MKPLPELPPGIEPTLDDTFLIDEIRSSKSESEYEHSYSYVCWMLRRYIEAEVATRLSKANKWIDEAKPLLLRGGEDAARIDWLQAQLEDSYLPLAHHGHRSQLDEWNSKNYDPTKPFAVGELDKKWGESLRAAIDAARK